MNYVIYRRLRYKTMKQNKFKTIVLQRNHYEIKLKYVLSHIIIIMSYNNRLYILHQQQLKNILFSSEDCSLPTLKSSYLPV